MFEACCEKIIPFKLNHWPLFQNSKDDQFQIKMSHNDDDHGLC